MLVMSCSMHNVRCARVHLIFLRTVIIIIAIAIVIIIIIIVVVIKTGWN